MFYFLLTGGLTPPSLSDFLDKGIVDGVKNFLSFIFSFFANLLDSLKRFYDILVEINKYVLLWVDSASGGSTNGLPILESIGAYRYLVGEPAFYLTYVLVVSGCLFTIFKLANVLYSQFNKLQKSILDNGKTSTGLFSIITKFFS